MADQAATGTVAAPAGTTDAAAASTQQQSAGAAATSADQKPGAAQKQAEIKYDLKLPDGSPLGKDWMEKTVALARERGFSAEQAQAALEHGIAAVQQYSDARESETRTIVEGWAKEAENDKEIGGANFAKNAEYAKRVIDRFGTDAFKTALNETGTGNHPELIRIFARIGRLMAEDSTVLGGGRPSASQKSREEVLYGGNKQQ